MMGSCFLALLLVAWLVVGVHAGRSSLAVDHSVGEIQQDLLM